MGSVNSIDPRSGEVVETVATEHDIGDAGAIVGRAMQAGGPQEAMGRGGRARMLRRTTHDLEERRGEIVSAAGRETALGEQTLQGELTRTAYQLRLFADVLRDDFDEIPRRVDGVLVLPGSRSNS